MMIYFPNECLIEVFKYLECSDIHNVAKVNKQWEEVAGDPDLWRHILVFLKISVFEPETLENDYIESSIRSIPNARCIQIDNVYDGQDKSMLVLKTIRKYCENINHMEIHYLNAEMMKWLNPNTRTLVISQLFVKDREWEKFSIFWQLERLEIWTVHQCPSRPWIFFPFLRILKLEMIRLTGDDLKNMEPLGQQLHILHINTSRLLPHDIPLIRVFTNLKRLYISDSAMTKDKLRESLKFTNILWGLILDEAFESPVLSDTLLENFFNNPFPTLRKLQLKKSRANNGVIKVIRRNCLVLESFEISMRCELSYKFNLTHIAFEQLIHMPSLVRFFCYFPGRADWSYRRVKKAEGCNCTGDEECENSSRILGREWKEISLDVQVCS